MISEPTFMLGAHVPGSKEPQERSLAGSGFHCASAACFLALHDADCRRYVHPGFARSFNGGDG